MALGTRKASVRPGSSRPKPQLSCYTCRARKLKCDRGRPCSNCAKALGKVCIYPSNNVGSTAQLHARTSMTLGHEDRISSLERRLQKVVAVLEDSATNASREALADQEPSLHRVTELPQERAIVTPTWEGVLSQITGVRREISSIRSSSPEASITSATHTDATSPHLLFSHHTDISREELRFLMVTRPVAEALLDTVTEDVHARWIFVLVHRPTFRKEVTAYWQNPMDVDLAWLSIFYSVLGIASHQISRSSILVDDLPLPGRMSHLCLIRAAQCLRDSKYTSPSAHTICAMLLYLASEHNWARNGHFGASMIVGITVGLALRRGYHRDPSWSKMTSFEGEMRRRHWAFLKQLDHLIAKRCGLPRFIDDRKTDTILPQNLLDEDLHPGMLSLPPACSDDMPTAIAVLNYKSRIWAIHGRITDQMLNVQPAEYEIVLDLEQSLVTEVDQIPPWLKTNFTAGFDTVAVDQRNAQIEVDLMVQSARMALHHRYLIPARTDPKYTDSRRACLAAARRALVLQRSLFERGDVYPDSLAVNWRFISLMAHDFLFAALLLCLDMYQGVREDSQFAAPPRDGTANAKDRSEHLQLLQAAERLWSTFGEHHSSGKEAARVLETLLKRLTLVSRPAYLDTYQTVSATSQQEPIEHKQSNEHSAMNAHDTMPLEYCPIGAPPSLTSFFDPVVAGYSQPQEGQIQPPWGLDFPNSDFTHIQSMLNESQIDFDWNAWNVGMPGGEITFTDASDSAFLL